MKRLFHEPERPRTAAGADLVGLVGLVSLWLATAGIAADPPPVRPVRLEARPAMVELSGPDDRVQLVLTAFDDRDRPWDVTGEVSIKSASDIAEIGSGNVIVGRRAGTAMLRGRLGTLTVDIPLAIATGAARPVSFLNDIVPILTSAGCNAGTCHGSPGGKNGFRLSLRGFDPALDYRTLTREVAARRVNRFAPDDSLVLKKATAQMPHEGGRRFRVTSEPYRLLRTWIAGGAVDEPGRSPALVSLEVFPTRRLIDAVGSRQQLRVVATYSDHGRRDVTHLARYSINDESVASVDRNGLVHKQSRGEVTVAVEYRDDQAASTLAFLDLDPDFTWPDPPVTNEIDHRVFAKLRRLRIVPSGLCTDEEFIRRVTLDVTGQLPTPGEIRGFLEDSRPDRRVRLIDQLLDRPAFADWWAMKWTDRLGCNQRFVGKSGAIKYHRWIASCMAVNMPEDQFVRAILTAGGGNYGNPPAGFWRRLRKGGLGAKIDPLLAGEEVSQLFLGVRVQCARCHNHPGERWTQDDYYGWAAFFARVRFKVGPFFKGPYDKEDTVYTIRSGDVQHPRTGSVMPPTLLGAGPADISDDADRRAVLAEWLTAPTNRLFARAGANRLWFHLFGRGIVEPVDDFRGSNPPSNVELLDWLAEEFGRSGFDRKHLLGLILKSRTYQLSAHSTRSNQDDVKYFSHARVRLLQAEQLLDAVCQATEMPEQFSGFPLGLRAVQLPDGEYKHPFLEAFGRPARALACECERENNTNLVQALHLVSGRVVHEKVRSEDGRAARLAAAKMSDAEVVEELFLATLSRHPSEPEARLVTGRLAAAEPGGRRRVVEDILWTLINHREFLFQH